VDTTPPTTPTLAFTALSDATYTGGVLKYTYSRFGGQNHFMVTMTTSDTTSGITGYVFPNLGTGWTSTGTGNERTYTFGSTAVSTGVQTITVTNNAGLTSSATFTLAKG
jgi:hypothetical protein